MGEWLRFNGILSRQAAAISCPLTTIITNCSITSMALQRGNNTCSQPTSHRNPLLFLSFLMSYELRLCAWEPNTENDTDSNKKAQQPVTDKPARRESMQKIAPIRPENKFFDFRLKYCIRNWTMITTLKHIQKRHLANTITPTQLRNRAIYYTESAEAKKCMKTVTFFFS